MYINSLDDICSPVKNIPASEKPLDAPVRNVFTEENKADPA
jgi:hypothetical protein